MYEGQVYGSIVYLNSSDNVANSTLINSCTTNSVYTDGGGNISADPRLVDPDNNIYQLMSNSPGINLGTDTAGLGALDAAANPRVVNIAPDLGAYEFQGVGDPDGDGDGQSNADEFVAKTDATDPNSYFATDLTSLGGGSFGVAIPTSATDRIYQVEMSTDLTELPQVWTPVSSPTPGNGGDLEIPVFGFDATAIFRTRVRLP